MEMNRKRYYMELQIRKMFDIQALPGILIDKLTQILGQNGRAVAAIPKYHMNDQRQTSIGMVRAGERTLYLQYFAVEIVLFDFLEGIKNIQHFVKNEDLDGLCRLKFQSEYYNLLNENTV